MDYYTRQQLDRIEALVEKLHRATFGPCRQGMHTFVSISSKHRRCEDCGLVVPKPQEEAAKRTNG